MGAPENANENSNAREREGEVHDSSHSHLRGTHCSWEPRGASRKAEACTTDGVRVRVRVLCVMNSNRVWRTSPPSPPVRVQ